MMATSQPGVSLRFATRDDVGLILSFIRELAEYERAPDEVVADAKLAVERGCGRFEWWVLDWNRPAIDFYRRLGAVGMDEWTVQRLTGPALAALTAGFDAPRE